MINKEKDTETFCPASRQQWRHWLEAHHDKGQPVWLVHYKMGSGRPSLSWSEAVDEALCFGWIDNTRRSVDQEKFMQFFSKRKPASVWSKVNKEKVARLIAQGRMTRAGLDAIEAAKQNGSWAILDDAEALKIPADLEAGFESHPGAKVFFLSLSRSVRKSMLQWLVLAKKPETRQKRIAELAELAARSLKPKQF